MDSEPHFDTEVRSNLVPCLVTQYGMASDPFSLFCVLWQAGLLVSVLGLSCPLTFKQGPQEGRGLCLLLV